MRHQPYRYLIAYVSCLFLFGCAELDEGIRKTADSVAPQDIVTGKRVLNPEAESDEIKRASEQAQQVLVSEQAKGHPVDTDSAMLIRLQGIMSRIAKVSHRPNLPWEVHLIESPDNNAFTIGGGKIFFYKGLLGGLVNPNNDNEIAAVMAHEMGHDAARHIGKSQGLELAAALSKKAKKATDSALYHASFSTLQEDEADRIGLLYMALAGYDPSCVSDIWKRANEKEGSDPHTFHYAYDHSLNSDRSDKTAKLTSVAQEYFKGQGIANDSYVKILASNELLPRTNTSEDGSGYVAAINAAADTYVQHLEAKNEELSRQLKMQEEQNALQRLTRLDFQIGDSSNGYKALFGHFQNGSTKVITAATITVYYVNSAGQPIKMENVLIQNSYLMPGQIANWSAYMRNVPGAANVRAKVTQVNWEQ